MATDANSRAHPWWWVPTLYFAQGIPYVAVTSLSIVMYKNLGVSNTDIALYTSWLYLPWVIKPVWSPLVELAGTKRAWTVALQFVLGAALATVALALPGTSYFRTTLAAFWLIAFASATHDIAADGFYMLALTPARQAAFVGIRSTFYRIAMIAGQGGLVWLAGFIARSGLDYRMAWSSVLVLTAAVLAACACWHSFALPRPQADGPAARTRGALAAYFRVFAAFFRKKGVVLGILFMLLYRSGESQLVRLVTPFLLDARSKGGLGLDNEQVGILYGTIGVVALLAGGVLGGVAIARYGLRRCLWPMAACINVPNAVYVILARWQPESLAWIGTALAAEQFGYGIGFAAYLVYMMKVAEGPEKTAHYAICTGFMALGMMVPGMVAGKIADTLGYAGFFTWVCVATVPSFIATGLVAASGELRPKAEGENGHA